MGNLIPISPASLIEDNSNLAQFPALGMGVNRLGPFTDSTGGIWVVGFRAVSLSTLLVWGSTDNGATWTAYTSASAAPGNNGGVTAVIASDVIYVAISTNPVIQIWSFTISTTTWARVDSGTGPSVSASGLGNGNVVLVRRSTGEFVVAYQGPTHTSMGSQFRSTYYARCSSAGVWVAGVEVDAGGSVNFDFISACLGASDRVHIVYKSDASVPNPVVHRSVDSTNVLDTAGNVAAVAANNYLLDVFYNATLAKVVVSGLGNGGTNSNQGSAYRGNSQAAPTWTVDSNVLPFVQGNPHNLAYTDGALYMLAMVTTLNGGEGLAGPGFASAAATTWPSVATRVAGPQTGSQSIDASQAFGQTILQQIAQTFKVPVDWLLTDVGFSVGKQGAPTDSLVCDVRDASPTGTLLGTSDTILGSSLGAVGGEPHTFHFSTPVVLERAKTYAFVIRRTGALDDTNKYSRQFYTTSDAYPNGGAQTFDGATWAAQNFDMVFFLPPPDIVHGTGFTAGLVRGGIGVAYRDGTTFGTVGLYYARVPTAKLRVWPTVASQAVARKAVR